MRKMEKYMIKRHSFDERLELYKNLEYEKFISIGCLRGYNEDEWGCYKDGQLIMCCYVEPQWNNGYIANEYCFRFLGADCVDANVIRISILKNMIKDTTKKVIRYTEEDEKELTEIICQLITRVMDENSSSQSKRFGDDFVVPYAINIDGLFDFSQGDWTKNRNCAPFPVGPVAVPWQRFLYNAAEKAGFKQALTASAKGGIGLVGSFTTMIKDVETLKIEKPIIIDKETGMIFISKHVIPKIKISDELKGQKLKDIVLLGKPRPASEILGEPRPTSDEILN